MSTETGKTQAYSNTNDNSYQDITNVSPIQIQEEGVDASLRTRAKSNATKHNFRPDDSLRNFSPVVQANAYDPSRQGNHLNYTADMEGEAASVSDRSARIIQAQQEKIDELNAELSQTEKLKRENEYIKAQYE